MVELDRFDADTAEGRRTLTNVVATRAGAPGPGIVVVAHRDSLGAGARPELSATAALLELARVTGDGRLNRTITFISTTGGSSGAAGAARAAERLEGRADAVLVLGAMGGPALRRPFVVGFSNGRGQAPIRLRRTVEAAVSSETGRNPGGFRAAAQWARLAAPATIGEQGPFARDGQPAVLLSSSGGRPPGARGQVTDARLQSFGRAALRSMYALDNGPDIASPPRADLVTRGRVLPGWAVRLLVGALLLPPLVTAIDGYARARRRREWVGPWAWWTLAGALPFAAACLFAVLLGAVGLLGGVPPAPLPAPALALDSTATAGLVALLLLFALGWLALRPFAVRLAGVRGRPAPAAGIGVLLVACAAVALLWIGNPYAAALAVPALHLWTWAVVPGRLPRLARVALVALGTLLPLLVFSSLAGSFGWGRLEALWAWILLVAAGHVPLVTWLLWSVVWGAGVSAAIVAVRTPRERAQGPTGVTVRGPVSYAGPGSLGGTESALRR
ncbi:MAG: M28 family peptidase [Solirubrobacterales bacterium]|nr:M28 family peptidase [Solirubrobacterales bacterium]